MRTDFEPAERGAMLRAARSVVEEVARGQPARVELAEELGQEEVFGLFTTLRRGGLLRSCIGHWPAMEGREEHFGELLRLSASHAAACDVRFPSIHPAELDLIEVELSVLFPPQVVPGSAEERLAGVVPGKHGVILEVGGRRGVLLPQVAAEKGWDAGTFLHHLCLKVGVPTGAWRDPRAQLKVFEALHFCDAPRQREVTVKDMSSGIAARLGDALRQASTAQAGRLQEHVFDFWTGILLETDSGPEFCLRQSGNLGLLAGDALARLSGRASGSPVRRVSLLTHALPLRATDDPQRRQGLGGDAICVHSEGRLSLRVNQERTGDPVPETLRVAGVSRTNWLQGEADVFALTSWPAWQLPA